VLSDLDTLRDQGELFGPVASAPTLRRALAEIDNLGLDRINAARAAIRCQVWALIAARHGAIRASTKPGMIHLPRTRTRWWSTQTTDVAAARHS
jgi:hypothetical protein